MSDQEEKLRSSSSDASLVELGSEDCKETADEDLAEKVMAELEASNEEEFVRAVEDVAPEPVEVSVLTLTASGELIEEINTPPKSAAHVVDFSVSRRPMLDESNDEGDDDSEDEEDDDLDETLVERLAGLTEMFPNSLRRGAKSLVSNTWTLAQFSYALSRTISWVVFSSSAVLFLPLMIETERMGIDEAQKQHQRQILLGPGAAVSAGGNAPLPNLPM